MTKFAVIASEQSERGNPKSKNNAKFMACHAVFAKTARNDALAVILSASEVSKNGKFSFNLCGFFCCGLRPATRWVATLKMTKRAQKPKNKVFKNFNVLKSASNERERERERERSPPPKHFSHFCLACFVRKHCSIFSVLNLQCCHTLLCLQTPFSPHLPSRICRALFCPQILATLNLLCRYA